MLIVNPLRSNAPANAPVAMPVGALLGVLPALAILRAGLVAVRAAAGDVGRVLVVLGDTPRLESAVVEDVLAAAISAPSEPAPARV